MGLFQSKAYNKDWDDEFQRANIQNMQFNGGQELSTTTSDELSKKIKIYEKTTQKTAIGVYTIEQDVKIERKGPKLYQITIKFTSKLPAVKVVVSLWGNELFETPNKLLQIISPMEKLVWDLEGESPSIRFEVDLSFLEEMHKKMNGKTFHSFIVEVLESQVISIYCFQINFDEKMKTKLIKKAVVVNGVYSVLQCVFGMNSSSLIKKDNTDNCLICFSEPINVIINPCMHMCLCSGCAEELSLKTKLCPICRVPFIGCTNIKVNENPQQNWS